MDGEAWKSPPSMGVDEPYQAGLTGLLSVAIGVSYTQAVVGTPLDFYAQIGGKATGSRWNFGDGDLAENRLDVSHAWSMTGRYAAVWTAWNASYPAGISATVAVQVAGGSEAGGVLSNCLLSGNSSHLGGGGSCYGTLYNCTLTGNSTVKIAGGCFGCILYNCIVYHNTAPSNANYYGGTVAYSCTTPKPGGAGNMTNDPSLIDAAGGNYRLQSNSPCINTGINQDWMAGAPDRDGQARIINSRVDMGAYESSGWGMWADVDGACGRMWMETSFPIG